MGLPIRDLIVRSEIPWSSLAGRRLAIDGNNAMYQFLATIRQRDGQPFSDPEGRVTSHLMGVLYRTASLLSEGIGPVWVFDGRPPELKSGTLRARFLAKERAEAEWKEALDKGDLETARRKAAATSRFTRPMAAEAMELLKALGVPTVQAPSEGEAQAARMAAEGAVWSAASEDYDSLLFGAPRLVRGLAARPRGASQPPAQLVERERVLSDLGISEEELLMIGLLVGTDFNDGAKGYGPKRSLALVRRHLGWSETLKIGGIPEEEARAVAEIFRSPEVVPSPPIAFGEIDEAQVDRLLVEGHGFSQDRVHATLSKARAGAEALHRPHDGRKQALLDAFP